MTMTVFFAAGCFWGVQAYFKKVTGVKRTKVGYTGGRTVNPTYKDVCTGRTGHAEAVEVEFDPDVVSFEQLLEHFWRIHDPTSLDRQGNDVGSQYRSAIFFTDDNQKKEALRSMAALERSSGSKIVTKIEQAGRFYPAEDYHQDYLDKNPGGYCHIDLSDVR